MYDIPVHVFVLLQPDLHSHEHRRGQRPERRTGPDADRAYSHRSPYTGCLPSLGRRLVCVSGISGASLSRVIVPFLSTLSCSDRCRTTNNLLGDCYGAAVVEALSRDELRRMDLAKVSEVNPVIPVASSEKGPKRNMTTTTDLENGCLKEDALNDGTNKVLKHKDLDFVLERAMLMSSCRLNQDDRDDDNTNMSGVESPCGSINGSSVEVPEVIIVDSGADNSNEESAAAANGKKISFY